ncbi:related to Protein rai1 [Ramularia collo-cygni]|uniref:Decapping nuclease n=1 Tax=Ramularia collo-cygni TaxID=112498 RepID=A0A2D3V5H3_9PEZI|nr:related to Protein rai1 [Ramularia collo-cygni]CZT21935.1 related to Protein rai1 [Ramularia collo-cygni]
MTEPQKVFKFHDLRPFESTGGVQAAIKRPREVTEFSFDEQHICHPLDGRSLRYYYPPQTLISGNEDVGIDLSVGFESFEKYDESSKDLHLEPLLETLEAFESKSGEKVEAGFVTWRGMMTKILTAPFDGFGEWEMNAVRFEDTIYIEENKSVEAVREAQSNNNIRLQHGAHSQEKMQYWGYKFETLSTLPRSWAECSRTEIESRESEVVNNYAQYCSIARTGIGNHTLVLAGEVDAVLGCKPDDGDESQIPYVELKTSEDFDARDGKSAVKFERKMCRFWAQSFLLGVPSVVVGFRDRNGWLRRMEEFKTLAIPGVVKRGRGTWDGSVCINFTAKFLDFLQNVVTGDGTWRIERKKGAKEILVWNLNDQRDHVVATERFREHRTRARSEAQASASASK